MGAPTALAQRVGRLEATQAQQLEFETENQLALEYLKATSAEALQLAQGAIAAAARSEEARARDVTALRDDVRALTAALAQGGEDAAASTRAAAAERSALREAHDATAGVAHAAARECADVRAGLSRAETEACEARERSTEGSRVLAEARDARAGVLVGGLDRRVAAAELQLSRLGEQLRDERAREAERGAERHAALEAALGRELGKLGALLDAVAERAGAALARADGAKGDAAGAAQTAEGALGALATVEHTQWQAAEATEAASVRMARTEAKLAKLGEGIVLLETADELAVSARAESDAIFGDFGSKISKAFGELQAEVRAKSQRHDEELLALRADAEALWVAVRRAEATALSLSGDRAKATERLSELVDGTSRLQGEMASLRQTVRALSALGGGGGGGGGSSARGLGAALDAAMPRRTSGSFPAGAGQLSAGYDYPPHLDDSSAQAQLERGSRLEAAQRVGSHFGPAGSRLGATEKWQAAAHTHASTTQPEPAPMATPSARAYEPATPRWDAHIINNPFLRDPSAFGARVSRASDWQPPSWHPPAQVWRAQPAQAAGEHAGWVGSAPQWQSPACARPVLDAPLFAYHPAGGVPQSAARLERRLASRRESPRAHTRGATDIADVALAAARAGAFAAVTLSTPATQPAGGYTAPGGISSAPGWAAAGSR